MLMNHLGSSRCWTAWCWIKNEWLLTKKNERIDFLLECKKQNVVPKFIQDRIKTHHLIKGGQRRIAANERKHGLMVLAMIIREEFQERIKIRQTTATHRRNMFYYNKEDYLYTKTLKQSLVEVETTEARKRLSKKLEKLGGGRRPSTIEVGQKREKERVTCIGVTISELERTLLEKGPKFVPTRRKLDRSDLRSVESAIENTANSFRWKRENNTTCNPPAKVAEERNAENKGTGWLLLEPKILRLKNETQRARQPPRMDVESERQVSDLKARIMQAYKQYHPSQSNVTKAERNVMEVLKKQDSTIIKNSDKSKSLVVLDKDTYLWKAENILADTDTYEITDMSSETLEGIVCKELKKIKGLKTLPLEIYNGLFPKDSKLPEFYGLPKIHKENNPLRPVVAAFDGPLTPISILLERILHQLLPFVPSHIENTAAAINSLEKARSRQRESEEVIICNMDVIALYPSIPIEDGISTVVNKLTKHKDDIDTAGLTMDEIKSLLQLVLNNNYFKFGQRVYRQRQGVAMGNHLAPPFAIVFMDQLEQKMLRQAKLKPASYDRYVDDCLVVWTHGERNLLKFIDQCNKQHPNIRFTWESTARGNPVSYMDLGISLDENNYLQYELYQKPSDSGVNLNFESCIPKHVKIAVAMQQFRRAHKLSSNATTKRRSEERIRNLLRANNFPEEVIRRTHAKTSKTSTRREKRNKESTVVLRLPFCSDSLDKVVRKTIKKSRLPIRVVYEQSASLKGKLVRSALLPARCTVHDKFEEQQRKEKRQRGKPRDDCISCQAGIRKEDCETKGAIYLLKCTLCFEEYVGESQRPIRTRLQEHHADARKRTKNTPWGDHMKHCHPDTPVDKTPVFRATILAIELRVTRRKIREAIEIRDCKPKINKNKGWKLD